MQESLLDTSRSAFRVYVLAGMFITPLTQTTKLSCLTSTLTHSTDQRLTFPLTNMLYYLRYMWVISWQIYSQKFFFDETFFLPFYFENNRHVFFFSMWYLKISRYNFFNFPFQNFACILKKLQQRFRNKKISSKFKKQFNCL